MFTETFEGDCTNPELIEETMASLTLGKSILTLVALITAIGPYAADWK